jgi:hypothetical protein
MNFALNLLASSNEVSGPLTRFCLIASTVDDEMLGAVREDALLRDFWSSEFLNSGTGFELSLDDLCNLLQNDATVPSQLSSEHNEKEVHLSIKFSPLLRQLLL